MEHSIERMTIVSALSKRGFEVERQLTSTHQSSILIVREEQQTNTSAGPYAAKVVSFGGLDAQGRAAALQEVSVLRGIASHPNLIQYRDSILEDLAGILLIVMSFAEDGDLRSVVANAKASQIVLPESAIVWWVRQMLAGLKHLHKQSVIHRDLKSSNVFLCEGRRRVRIGDFGISKVLESTNLACSCVGTPAYMSPELMRNEPYEFHVDLWAMGCLIFELCALRLPFVARSLLDLVQVVVNGSPDWNLWDSSYSGDLRFISANLLNKQAAERMTAAQAVAFSLFEKAHLPSEEIWSVVSASDEEITFKGEATCNSQASTADTVGDLDGHGGSGSWALAPSIPWETSVREDRSISISSISGGFHTIGVTDSAPATSRLGFASSDAKDDPSSCFDFQAYVEATQSRLQLNIGSRNISDLDAHAFICEEAPYVCNVRETLL